MMVFYITIAIFILISIIAVIYGLIYNKFQELLIKTNEVEASIDAVLRKRFDLLNKSINIIKANTIVEHEVLELIVKLRSRKLSNFELDRQLYDAINEFNSYKEAFPTLMERESFTKIDHSLNDSEIEIIGLRKYYNDTITEYNKLVKKFPSNIVAKISKYKQRPYYDGKDMTDNITNDFKL